MEEASGEVEVSGVVVEEEDAIWGMSQQMKS